MKAVWYERFGPAEEVLTLGEMDAPEPGPGEVRVRVHGIVGLVHSHIRSAWRAYRSVISEMEKTGWSFM